MLTIRLSRVGKKKDPSFRVVVVDSKKKVKSGNYLEMVGSFDARVNRVQLNAARIKEWISQGAQPSDTVHNLLVSEKVIEGKKINVLPRKSPPKKEEVAPAEAPAAQAPVSAEASGVVEEPVAQEEGADTIEK
jgi:small subunit ribosomal protein S16